MPGDAPFLDLSVVIIAKNEERRLPACLGSLPPGAEVCVLDSGSEDRTQDVARAAGAAVAQRAFTDYAEQKNAAIAMATRRWVLSVDADEVLTPELARAVAAICRESAPRHAGYRLDRRLVFMGRQMRYGKTSDSPLRLFLRDKGRFAAAIHEKVELAGGATVGDLAGVLLHYSYDDITDYFRRFNDYTTRIADNHARNGKPMPPLAAHLVRPWVEFVSRYFLRLGFLDGYPGYCYALFSAVYTFVKYAKLRERLAR